MINSITVKSNINFDQEGKYQRVMYLNQDIKQQNSLKDLALRNGVHLDKTSQKSSIYLSNITVNDASTFISFWNTSMTSRGSGNNNSLKLPLTPEGTYNFTVYWGDGSNATITHWNQTESNHTYASTGIYEVSIDGILDGWQFNNQGDRTKLIEISQWGNLRLGNTGNYFYGSSNLLLTAHDSPILNETTTMLNAFRNCDNLGDIGNMNGWNMSTITTFDYMFYDATSFNMSISDWDVSNALFMEYTFYLATSFNLPLENWNVSNVISMENMFGGAEHFNQPLDNWDVSSVSNMLGMFAYAFDFNQSLENWDVSNVVSMAGMFNNARKFNQKLGGWDISNVQTMAFMFAGVSLSVQNYDNLLIGWSNLDVQFGVTFHAGRGSHYSKLAYNSRQILESVFDWHIVDGGEVVTTTTTTKNSQDPGNTNNKNGLGANLPSIIISIITIGMVYRKTGKLRNM